MPENDDYESDDERVMSGSAGFDGLVEKQDEKNYETFQGYRRDIMKREFVTWLVSAVLAWLGIALWQL